MALLLFVVAPARAQIDTDLMLHWKFDDGYGAEASDSSGNDRNGTLLNGPVWDTGQVSNALSFDGVNQRVASTYNAGLIDVSLSVWINRAIDGGGKIVSKSEELSLAVDAETGKISYTHEFSGQAGTWTTNSTVPDSAWRHVVVTHDTDSGLDPIIYINGEAQTTMEVPPLGGVAYSTAIYRVAFDGVSHYNGLIDEVRIYDRALSASDVGAIFHLEHRPVGICASGLLVPTGESDSTDDWVRLKCADPGSGDPEADPNGFAKDWTEAIRPGPLGLSYVTFLVNGEKMGGEIRFNGNPTSCYEAVVVAHSGSAGTDWPEDPRDGDDPADSSDWQDLQDTYGMRVVGVRWDDIEVAEGKIHGRFTRKSSAGTTLGKIDERPKLLFEWIYNNLNPDQKPFALIGGSGGADAVLSPQLLQSWLKDKVDYLGVVSYASPFFDPYHVCRGETPENTYVDPETGAPGPPDPGDGGVGPNAGPGVVDYVLSLKTSETNCQDGDITEQQLLGSSSKDTLEEILENEGSGYTGTLHVLVGTACFPVEGCSDLDNGGVWAAGNLMNHAFFIEDDPEGIWFKSANDAHGAALRNVGSEGFEQVYNQLASLGSGTCSP